MKKDTSDDFSWLVQQRCHVQNLLLDLYRYVLVHERELIRNSTRRDRASRATYLLLIGVAFSLWRAVFLTNEKRTPARVVGHARKFLEAVVRDNTITFNTDRDLHEWSAGYYINNARYRLAMIREKLFELHPRQLRAAKSFKRFATITERGIDTLNRDMRHAWRICFEAACEGLDILRGGNGRR
jgi:hypothetical protein